jgi:hypothetical protein
MKKRRDDKEEERIRHDLWLALLLALLGFVCLWITGALAITPPSVWQVSRDMLSKINPDAGDGEDVKLIEPVSEKALTPLPPDILATAGTPSPVPIAVVGKPVEDTATPQPTDVPPTSPPTATPVPHTSTPSPVPTQPPTETPTATQTRLPTLTATGTSTAVPTPTDTAVPPPPTGVPRPTNTSVPSTATPTSTPTDTPTSTPTDTPTSTPTDTPTSTPTDTPTSTPTDTPTPTTDVSPDAPTSLRAAAGDSQVNLGWDDFTIEPDLVGYLVYSSTTSGGPFYLHASVPITEYLDSTVINATTYYYQVTAIDAGSNESAASNVASALPYSLAPYTFTTTIDTCSGPPDCSAATGQPDGSALNLGDTGYQVTLDFGDGYGIMDGVGYDMVFYESPFGTGIQVDFVTIDLSYNGSTWYTVFNWDGNAGGVLGTNIDAFATDGGGEQENESIDSSFLYNNTGIAIDIGPWTLAGYSFRYVRFTDAGGSDSAQIDAVERLN